MKTTPPDKKTPFAFSEPDGYSRLFRPATSVVAPTDPRLECLAWSMRKKYYPDPGPEDSLLPAAYTYFGQFIDHDMTYEGPSVDKDGSPMEPHDIPNLRRNWLNLDSLYGDGPGTVPEGIYAADGTLFNVSEVFVAGKLAFDVPLDASTSHPLAADPRNIENAILRQLHAMLLKLHNKAVKDRSASFSEARLRVTHQYQWLVRNDFLKNISDSPIYNGILVEPLFDWKGRFSIPVEFSRAAFRFGHSMVRESYGLGPSNAAVSLCTLFGGRNSLGPIPSKHTVIWSRFLTPRQETSNFIDTSVVSPLFDVPHSSTQLFKTSVLPGSTNRNPSASPCGNNGLVLPHATLQRGATAQLPSGQSVYAELFGGSTQFQGISYDPYADLKKCQLEKEIPLWYYVLLEAERHGKGLRLGPVGSRIVGEVIEGALLANKESYLNVHKDDPSWKPDKWKYGDGEWEINTLRDVAIVVGLMNP